MHVPAFMRKLQARQTVVGVVGLGYVGLPLSLRFARAGFHVLGVDTDPAKVAALKEGRSYIRHLDAADLREQVAAGRLAASGDARLLGRCDAVLICVPTPLTAHSEPDMSYIESTAAAVGAALTPGQLVVLESTTYPGTTDGLLRERLQAASGLRAGDDFFLAFSPEREDPGRGAGDGGDGDVPKVVGGLTPACREVAGALYGAVVPRVVEVSSTAVAEMSKLLENIFRSVNIALVNELKKLCHAMDIDIWEVIAAAATKPFGFMPFHPGPGLGGHCIPIDPFYLAWKARAYDQPTRFIELAGEVNTGMPAYVAERVALALNGVKKAVHGSRVLIVGVAYKRGVDDLREAPALRLMELLRGRGAELCYHDPFVPTLPKTRAYDFGLSSVPLCRRTLAAIDVAVVVTDHAEVDYAGLVHGAPLVVDTRNATRAVVGHRDRIVHA